MSHNPTVVTRFPPSPTGKLQIGNVRTALFNYLYAKKHGGKFVMRIEDTDVERSKKEYEDAILADMEWLGFSFDDFARQSDRKEIHKGYLNRMIEAGSAYISKEEGGEGKRDEVIRFKNPNRIITFHDEIRGSISIDTTDLGDFVVAKSVEEPVYHLAVAIDDFEMGVTHVIRGEDHISNTPRQILLLEAIGAPIPTYAHLPLVLAADKTKLSKRNGSVSLEHLRSEGYLKEAVINFLALLGWNPGTDQELFTLDELIEKFELHQIQKGGGVFNVDRLNWFNREYLKRLPPHECAEKLAPYLAEFPALAAIFQRSPSALQDVLQRINAFGDIKGMAESGEFSYYTDTPSPDAHKIIWKDSTAQSTLERLEHVIHLLDPLTEHTFTAEGIKAILLPYAEAEGKGAVLWPMRYSLSGKDRSPDPFTLGEALGRKETLVRLEKATALLRDIME